MQGPSSGRALVSQATPVHKDKLQTQVGDLDANGGKEKLEKEHENEKIPL